MEAWKPVMLVVPAGLLLGIVAGQASRPEMLIREDRPWPQSVAERAFAIEPWRPIYEGGPQDLSPRSYSYRPALDYDAFAWPDQADRSAELLADYAFEYSDEYDFDTGPAALEPNLPLTRGAPVELASDAAAAAAADVSTEQLVPAAPMAQRAAAVLPPVPPPLPLASSTPALATGGEAEAMPE